MLMTPRAQTNVLTEDPRCFFRDQDGYRCVKGLKVSILGSSFIYLLLPRWSPHTWEINSTSSRPSMFSPAGNFAWTIQLDSIPLPAGNS
ncbi:hypothetical protein B0H12DRAFT_1108076 [Mycena haematopus]|nr:hypothetical protein B0H12DRAFT_1146386 [Mycena haematopus]KAJ7259947.1 hypothetical protein B0H12DRAFT_1108076 [Mycena haematopus]